MYRKLEGIQTRLYLKFRLPLLGYAATQRFYPRHLLTKLKKTPKTRTRPSDKNNRIKTTLTKAQGVFALCGQPVVKSSLAKVTLSE